MARAGPSPYRLGPGVLGRIHMMIKMMAPMPKQQLRNHSSMNQPDYSVSWRRRTATAMVGMMMASDHTTDRMSPSDASPVTGGSVVSGSPG